MFALLDCHVINLIIEWDKTMFAVDKYIDKCS